MIARELEFESEWERRQWEALKDLEALRGMCWSIMLRTLRDLYTYQDRSRQHRKNLYDTSFNWVFQLDPADEDQPMSFVWVCDTLDLDHNLVAKRVWELRGAGFQALKRALVAMRETQSELQQ
jgi:hypothetical protein